MAVPVRGFGAAAARLALMADNGRLCPPAADCAILCLQSPMQGLLRSHAMPLPEPLISVSPGTLSGAPVFNGTRVPVKTLFDYLEAGDPITEFLADFPNVTREHAVAVLEMARQSAVEAASQAAE
jgi:uncharacterized protein (DUF433 family)